MVVVTSLLLFFLGKSTTQDFNFIDDLLKNGTYDVRVRPNAGKHPVNITSQVTIAKLSAINEQTFTYEVDFYFRQWWHDHRLVQNDTSTPLTTNTLPESLVWTPSLSIVNAEEVRTRKTDVRTIINFNGDVYVSRRMLAICKCKMDLKYYPMDMQICPLIFESYAFTKKDMILYWHKKPVVHASELNISGYTIEDIYATAIQTGLTTGDINESYDNLIVHFKVKRTFIYFVYRVYSPTMLLMVFNLGSYWIPASAIPARVTLIVTTFLASTFILQSVSEQTVKVSDTTPLQLFMLVNIVFIVTAILEYILVLWLQTREEKYTNTKQEVGILNDVYKHAIKSDVNTNTVANGDKTHAPKEMLPKSNTENTNTNSISEKIDNTAGVIVTLLYLAFCCTYFTYYLHFSKRD